MATGRFIVLEGLDGSGITTQTELLRTWCEGRGVSVYVTKEPSDGPAGSIIKQALKHRLQGLTPDALALLFAADRLDHVMSEIKPALSRGYNVVCDRYYLSSYAYQLVEVPDLDWLKSINNRCPSPDLTIYLDVPPKDCLQRIRSDVWRGSDQLQLYEEPSYLDKVRRNFLSVIRELGKQERIQIVDGTQQMRDIEKAVVSLVTDMLPLPSRSTRPGRKPSARQSGSEQVSAILRGDAIPS